MYYQISFIGEACTSKYRVRVVNTRSIYLTLSFVGGTGSISYSWTYSHLFALCLTKIEFIDNWKRYERNISKTFGVVFSAGSRVKRLPKPMFSEINIRIGRLAKLLILLHLDVAQGVLFYLDRSSIQPDRLLKFIAHVLRFFAIKLYFLFLISPSVTILSIVFWNWRHAIHGE